MEKRKFYAGIPLTNLIHVFGKRKNRAGQEVDVLVIPIDANHLHRKDQSVYLPVNIYLRDEPDQYKQWGPIKQKVPAEFWEKATEEQKEEFRNKPFMGNLYLAEDNNDNQGAIDPNDLAEVPDSDDGGDLPF